MADAAGAANADMLTATPSERRTTGAFALFEYGYRPFFLLAALHGAVLVPIWVAAVFGWVALPVEMEVSWHAHQMVYGFAAAGLAGFMLTAVPSWTGAPPLRGAPLAALALLWLVGRLAMTLTTLFPPRVAAGIDLAFIPALALGVIGPLLAARKAGNLMLLIPLAVFWIGDWMMQAQFTGIGEDTSGAGSRIGIDVMLLMIAVIGGRITPTFTTNALRASGSSAAAVSVPLVDHSAIAAMALLIAVEAVTEMSALTGVIALIAAVLNTIRLTGWRGERTLRSPILWILHLGYLWLIVGLALKGVAAALHALTIGAIGTMLLAVMSRAALGHTGRPLRAHMPTVGAYVLISVAAVLRVAAALNPTAYMDLLMASGIAWTVGFALFLWIYAPILVMPRTDGKLG
jgi:uncharacterized protein involved in response to NO